MADRKIVFSADLHGNRSQYLKLANLAAHTKAQAIIIGGDIAPKSATTVRGFIDSQRTFLRDDLPKLVSEMQKSAPVYLMMGNDDVISNYMYMGGLGCADIHRKRLKIGNLEIVGYPCVPITPFLLKDWEKPDFYSVPKDLEEQYSFRQQTNYRTNGIKTTESGWTSFEFNGGEDSIQKDLEASVFTQNPQNTIYIMHAPPDNTCLDITYANTHVGSMAIRKFIEERQPYLTLHGHIHETVEMSGSCVERIGGSVCATAGNHNGRDQVAALVIDPTTKSVERVFV